MNRGSVSIGNQLNSLNTWLKGISTAPFAIEQQGRASGDETDGREDPLAGQQHEHIEANMESAMSS